MIKLKIVDLSIDKVVPYDNNPRNNDDAVDSVAESIRQFGFKVPMILDKDNVIIAGHTRLKAAQKLGLETVPVIYADDLTEEQVKAFRLADNKTGELAEWDFALLENELAEIESLDMADFGFAELEELADEAAEELVEDEAPEPPEDPKSKLGEVYALGRHRLMCGDSTIRENLAILMGGGTADLVFTDPPYGMKKEKDGVLNDNLNYDDLLEFNKKWIPLTFEVLKENGSWYCWGIDEPLMDIYSNILRPMKKQHGAEKLTFQNLLTWEKELAQGILSPDYRMYPIADEKCLFVMRGRQTYGKTKEDYWDGFEPIRKSLIKLKDDLRLTTEEVIKYAGATTCSHWFAKSQWEFPNEQRFETLRENLLLAEKITREEYERIREEYERIREEYERIREEYDKIREEWYKTRAFFDNTHDKMTDVWHFQTTSLKERELTGGHATPKPIALCARAIKSSSREGEIVLDVFGGSGSTLIACEQTGRRAYIMELDPKYVDVIIQRWETLTGKKAELITDSE